MRVVQANSEVGLTVSLIDSILVQAKLLAARMREHHSDIVIGRNGDRQQPVREALRELNDCNDFKGLIEFGDREAMQIIRRGAELLEAGVTDKITLLLSMMQAAGGEIDASENPHSLLNYFCDDCGSGSDTFNQAIERGLIKSSFDSMFETSKAWLTDAGRSALVGSQGQTP